VASIEGYLGFDTLIYFSPFSFEVWMAAGVEIEYEGVDLAGIDLSMLLTGPSPWVARGKAKIHLLFVTVKVGFTKRWGDEQAVTLPEVDPWVNLKDALAKPDCWGAVLPERSSIVESLRLKKDAASESLVVHPSGRLEVRQKVVPLGLQLTRASNAPIAGHDRFDITAITIGDAELDPIPVEEFFARGQWEELGDQVLSVPAFEKMKAGVTADCDSTAIEGDVEAIEFAYKPILIGPDRVSVKPRDGNGKVIPGRLKWVDAKPFVKGQARRNALRRAGPQKRFAKPQSLPQVRLREEGYCIARASSLQRADVTLRGGQANRGMTRTMADQLLRAECDRQPGTDGKLIVVPECEVVV
jgi:hypothetical protein